MGAQPATKAKDQLVAETAEGDAKVKARRERVRRKLMIEPGAKADLNKRDTGWAGGREFHDLSSERLRGTAKKILTQGVRELSKAQELLWAADRYALLVVFQAIDAAGKDSTIEHVMSGVNPQGVQVVGFRKPSSEELDHDFLWRISRALPQRGRIGIFNRSHYEEVIALQVHPEWLEKQKLPPGNRGKKFWNGRFEDINGFEKHLDRNGTKIVKLFLHVSKAEQKKRFLARLDTPGKEWKFNAADVAERALWDDYMKVYDQVLTATSTEWAPWYVIPADNKSVMQAMVARIIVDTIGSLDLSWPTVTEEDRLANLEARKKLEAEPDDG
jgi:PPK2 family polyphosphate:nucleotide phosphotransferase